MEPANTLSISDIAGLLSTHARSGRSPEGMASQRQKPNYYRLDVRFGSLAAAPPARWRVRFTPESCRGCRRWSRQLWANSGHPLLGNQGRDIVRPSAVWAFSQIQKRLPFTEV